mgnify:CR=1 FL=1
MFPGGDETPGLGVHRERTGATSRGAFWGLLAGMAAVALVARYSSMAFLWHNVVGAVAVSGLSDAEDEELAAMGAAIIAAGAPPD